jgi:hypothetical protein
MTLEPAIQIIRTHLAQMAALYQKPVFDEWAVLATEGVKGVVLAYEGPRPQDFAGSFAADLRAFGAELLRLPHAPGDYDFSRHATGTYFDAYLVLGEGVFLICNNTTQSMAGITQDAHWLKAQGPFVDLSEQFRADPLTR